MKDPYSEPQGLLHRHISLLALLLLLHACASTPRYTEADAATWGTVNNVDACLLAGPDWRVDPSITSDKELETLEHNRQMWRKEVKRRGLLSPEEWKLVEQRQIATGMSFCALYISWGRPIKENATVAYNVPHVQHIYPAPGRYEQKYVYTVNGRVTSWQIPSR